MTLAEKFLTSEHCEGTELSKVYSCKVWKHLLDNPFCQAASWKCRREWPTSLWLQAIAFDPKGLKARRMPFFSAALARVRCRAPDAGSSVWGWLTLRKLNPEASNSCSSQSPKLLPEEEQVADASINKKQRSVRAKQSPKLGSRAAGRNTVSLIAALLCGKDPAWLSLRTDV